MCYRLLEEVAELMAIIDLHPEFPYAHLALKHSQFATQALETQLVNGQISVIEPRSLHILRKIASTHTPIALDIAILLNDVASVALSLQAGEDPTDFDNHAIRSACTFGFTEIVRLLLELPLERGVNPAARDNAALQHACAHGHTEIVRMLLDLERGVNPAACDNAARRHARTHGHTEIVRLLLALERGVAARG